MDEHYETLHEGFEARYDDDADNTEGMDVSLKRAQEAIQHIETDEIWMFVHGKRQEDGMLLDYSAGGGSTVGDAVTFFEMVIAESVQTIAELRSGKTEA